MSTIGVIGAGLMGHGIAYLLAAASHTVRIYDPSAEWRNSLPQRLEVARALLDGDKALLGRVTAHDQMAAAMKDAAFVFEAAPEKLPLKQQIFLELEGVTAPTTMMEFTVSRSVEPLLGLAALRKPRYCRLLLP